MDSHKNYRLFYFQSFISSAPTVLLISLVPYLLNHVFRSDVSLVQVGTLFLLLRLSMIIGSNLAHYLMKKFSFHGLCTALEGAHSIALCVLLYSIMNNSIILFYGSIFVRFIGLGVLNNIRFSWLKHLDEFENKSKIYIFSKVFIQFSYLIAGLTLIFFKMSTQLLYITVALDIMTSIIGSVLFHKLGSLSASKYAATDTSSFNFRFTNLKPHVLSLFITDALFAMSMGGINTFIYKNGETYFADIGGYGLVLVLYAIFYLVAGNIITNIKNYHLIKNLSVVGLGLSFLAVNFIESYYLCLIIFSFIFLCYTTFNLNLEKIWFNTVDKTNASMLFAKRVLLISLINAAGEYAYTLIPNTELQTRSVFAILTAVCFFISLKKFDGIIKT